MRVSRSKTEYMCFNNKGGPGDVSLEGLELPKVESFKYLGCLMGVMGNISGKRKVQAGWNSWRKISGLLCDRGITPKVAVRPAMMYSLKTLATTKSM